jgi:hypothetical protein
MMDLGTGGHHKRLHGGDPAARRDTGACLTPWSFVYGFFSNGTPFDAPNRSEPCPS